MTDQKKVIAHVVNEQGHKFSVYRLGPSGPVWANFSIANTSFDQLAADKPIMYRIDKNAPHTVERDSAMEELIGTRLSDWEPKWINFLLWHGTEQDGRASALVELMEGQILTVRYHLFTGGYRDTRFALDGAGPAIASALGISQYPDPSIERIAKAAREALLQCSHMPDLEKCANRVAECRDQAKDMVESFQQCFSDR